MGRIFVYGIIVCSDFEKDDLEWDLEPKIKVLNTFLIFWAVFAILKKVNMCINKIHKFALRYTEDVINKMDCNIK